MATLLPKLPKDVQHFIVGKSSGPTALCEAFPETVRSADQLKRLLQSAEPPEISVAGRKSPSAVNQLAREISMPLEQFLQTPQHLLVAEPTRAAGDTDLTARPQDALRSIERGSIDDRR